MSLTLTPSFVLRIRRSLTLGSLLLTLALALAAPASAHAVLVSSSPADGTVLAREPRQVTLVFSEDVTARLSSVHVIGPDGRRLDDRPPQAVSPGAERLVVGLAPDLQQGTFVLRWLATAADDGHTTSGGLTFSVGAPSTPSGTSIPRGFGAPDRVTGAVLDVATWSGFAGLALLTGNAVIRRCGGRPRNAATSHPRWPGSLGWSVLLAATVVQLFVYGPATQGNSVARLGDRALLGATLATREGHLLIARIVLLAGVAVAGEWLLRRASGAAAAALLALCLAATWSGTSHAADGTLVPLALAVITLHVTAFAVWAGGLFGLAVLPRDEVGAAAGFAATAARFSRVALAAVAVLAATGLYQAFREIGSFPELTGTSYGRLLLAKSAIVVLVIGTAAATRTLATRSARPRAAGTRRPALLRRLVVLELVGVTVVLAVTVALIGQPPPRSGPPPSPASPTSQRV